MRAMPRFPTISDPPTTVPQDTGGTTAGGPRIGTTPVTPVGDPGIGRVGGGPPAALGGVAASPFGINRVGPVVPPVLPSGDDLRTAWGGADPNRWRPEAVMANAFSKALNDAWFTNGQWNQNVW